VSKRTLSAIIAVAAIAMMLISLMPTMAIPGPGQGTVMGTVTDYHDGKPIEGALVKISYHGITKVDITDSAGKYRFTNVPECFCLKTINATKDGYRPESKDVGISGVTVVNFELWKEEQEPHMGTVMGTVTDYNNGEPLEGARVEISYHETIREVYTDSDGKYTFKHVPECYCLKKVTASMEHFRPESKEVGVSGVTVVDFELWKEEQEPHMGTVMGTVTDYNNGEPIEGAHVEISYHETVREVYTDSDGKYKFDNVPECYCLKTINVTMKGYISESKEVGVSGVTVVDFELWIEEQEPPQGTVMGTVTDYHNGEPIEGARVEISYHETVREMITQADGKYAFDEVPECRCLKTIKVTKKGYIPESKEVSVLGEIVVDFELRIEEQEPPTEGGVLTGIVSDAATGDPIADVLMTLAYHETVLTEYTDAEGRYTFTNVPICFCLKDISASKDGYKAQKESVAIDEETHQDFSLEPIEPEDEGSGVANGETRPVESTGYYYAITGLVGLLLVMAMIGVFMIARKR
jgi:protocatechuate 3,4-dioxygenase beta subunit